MAGIEVLPQEETLIVNGFQSPRRPRRYAARNNNEQQFFAALFSCDPPSVLADDETVIVGDILPRHRYAMRANPDYVRQVLADFNLRRRGHQISDDRVEQRLSSEIWRYLSTENYYERDECGGFCVVCQSELEEGEKLGKLRCGHSYHAPCIHTWLLKKNECPLCKQTAIPELQLLE